MCALLVPRLCPQSQQQQSQLQQWEQLSGAAAEQAAAEQAAKLSTSDCLSIVSIRMLATTTEAEQQTNYSSDPARLCIKMLRDQVEVQPALDRSATVSILSSSRRRTSHLLLTPQHQVQQVKRRKR